MTLNTSGPISLGGSTTGQSINLELGRSATAQVSLNESAVRTLAGVPSGAIVMPTNFYGKSSAVFRLDSDVYSDFGIAGVEPSTGVNFTVRSDGTILVTGDNSGTLANYNWITPTTGSTTYYVRAILMGGSFNSGTMATWLPLTSNRSWVVRVFTIDSRTATADFEIATDSGGTNVVVSGTVTLNAEMI